MTPQEIKDLRQRLEWSLQEMGQVMRISAMAISNWKRGKTAPGPYKAAALEQLRNRLNEAERQQRREQFEQTLKAGASDVGVGFFLHVLFKGDNEQPELGE